MPLSELPAPIFITRQHPLKRLVNELLCEPVIAVDTEANGLYAYREQVCLIQFSTPKADYLVDTLALDDLSPLAQVFENPSVEKVFHASEYDLIILHQDFGFSVNYLFDTMIAARILGWQKVGLGSILENEFGIKVNKKHQRANWGKRPIPDEMLKYAQVDTHFLLQLRDKIKIELKSKGRWDLAVEDFKHCSQVDSNNHRNDNGDCWRVRGAHDLHPQNAAVLKELCDYRNVKAQAADRPLFKIISDKTLLQIAETTPRSIRELQSIQGVSQKQVRWLGDGLISAVKRGLSAKPIRPKRKPRPSKEYLDRVEQLRRWRQRRAKQMNVMSDVILPKDLLYTLANKNPDTNQEVAQIMKSVPWRLQEFGEELYSLLKSSGR